VGGRLADRGLGQGLVHEILLSGQGCAAPSGGAAGEQARTVILYAVGHNVTAAARNEASIACNDWRGNTQSGIAEAGRRCACRDRQDRRAAAPPASLRDAPPPLPRPSAGARRSA